MRGKQRSAENRGFLEGAKGSAFNPSVSALGKKEAMGRSSGKMSEFKKANQIRLAFFLQMLLTPGVEGADKRREALAALAERVLYFWWDFWVDFSNHELIFLELTE